jgi:hypothetical protein
VDHDGATQNALQAALLRAEERDDKRLLHVSNAKEVSLYVAQVARVALARGRGLRAVRLALRGGVSQRIAAAAAAAAGSECASEEAPKEDPRCPSLRASGLK